MNRLKHILIGATCSLAIMMLSEGVQAQSTSEVLSKTSPQSTASLEKSEKQAKRDELIKKYMPKINGTIRAKYEYQPEIDAGRFEVRNARVSVSGNILPEVSYKAEIDLSDEGSIKMLDAYARYAPLNGFTFTIGQMRVPFTIDAHRSPHLQYFANRSFIAKQVGNVRDVGATLAYKTTGKIPVILEAGLFNGSGLTNQKEWHKVMNYSAKAQFFFTKGLNLTLGVQQIMPSDVKVHLYDIGTYYEFKRWHIEAEYLFKHYDQNAFHDVNAVNAFVNYNLPLKHVFKKIAFLARYDMMDNHSDAKTLDASGKLTLTDYKRHRITGGITLGIKEYADIRINYEKYLYEDGSTPKESEQDKMVVEFVIHF